MRRKMAKNKPDQLPEPITLKQSIGPSFILLGLALGSGELIMWPYLVSLYGLGIIWGGLVGITFQYFLNTEIMRYTLAWGESVFVGWRRWGKLIPAWFVFSTVIPWALPGFVSASATMLNHVFPHFAYPFDGSCSNYPDRFDYLFRQNAVQNYVTRPDHPPFCWCSFCRHPHALYGEGVRLERSDPGFSWHW